MSDKIAEAFGIEDVVGEIIVQDKKDNAPIKNYVEGEKTNKELTRDLEYARENYYSMIEQGADGLQEILSIAKQSQHPRAFEVVATLMKTLADTNKNLVELSIKKNEEKNVQSGPDKVTQNLFVGSTAELQKMINENKEKNV